MQKVLANINLKHLCDNARYFSSCAGVPVYAVVKADAYGHGAAKVAQSLGGLVQGFAVAILEEGLSLSNSACGKDILVFSPPTTQKEAWLLIKNRLIATVASAQSARLIHRVSEESGLTARVHIKCNTGMNRYGLTVPVLGKICKQFASDDKVKVEGIYSHLYAHDKVTTTAQRLVFVQAQAVCKRCFPRAKGHLSATYGALLGKDFAFDAVRIGLGLYGYLPDDVTQDAPIKKVMTIYAKCVDERKYRFGGSGYSCNAPSIGEKMATIRCGYADGLPYTAKDATFPLHRLSCPCMDACVCAGDGQSWSGKWLPIMTDARAMAQATGTICYDVLCRMSARAEKTYGYD